MQKIDILLKKKSIKSLIYFVIFTFISFVLLLILKLTDNKSDYISEILLYIGTPIVVFCLFIGLFQFFVYKEVHLIAESDGNILKFYCVNEKGKQFNFSKDINLNEMTGIYIVQRSSIFLTKLYDFEIEDKKKHNIIPKKRFNVFPLFFEANDSDRQAILGFVNSLKPNSIRIMNTLFI